MKIPAPEKVSALMMECADKIVMPLFGKISDVDIMRKQDGSKVTRADIESELFLKEGLKKLLAGSVTIGEEETENEPSILGRLTGDAPAWVIDPVDGTSNYAKGHDRFAMMVGLCHGGEPVAGWLLAPALGRAVWAMKGEGAWDGDRQLTYSGVSADPACLSGSLGGRIRRIDGVADHFGEVMNHSCVGFEYIEIACGRLDFGHYRRVKPWDHCAGDIVVRESGGFTGELMTGDSYLPAQPPKDGILVSNSSRGFDAVADVLRPVVAAL